MCKELMSLGLDVELIEKQEVEAVEQKRPAENGRKVVEMRPSLRMADEDEFDRSIL
jgi:hypothetical protein